LERNSSAGLDIRAFGPPESAQCTAFAQNIEQHRGIFGPRTGISVFGPTAGNRTARGSAQRRFALPGGRQARVFVADRVARGETGRGPSKNLPLTASY
jgi:hypothetical protein